jgi:hypothetical protein
VRRSGTLPCVLALAAMMALTGCRDTAPTATGSPSPSPSGPAPSGPLVSYPQALPDCPAALARIPSNVFTATTTPTAQRANDGWRESVTCEVSGSLPGGVSAVQVQVLLERPVRDPVQGVPVATDRTERPAQLMKQACPDSMYDINVYGINHGLRCHRRLSASKWQGLVAGVAPDATVLVTVTLENPDRNPGQLQDTAEKTAEKLAGWLTAGACPNPKEDGSC